MKSQSRPVVVIIRPREQSTLFDSNSRFRALTDELAGLFPRLDFVTLPFLYDATDTSEAVAVVRRLTCPLLVLSTLPVRPVQWLFDFLGCPVEPGQISFCQVEVFSTESLSQVLGNYLKTVGQTVDQESAGEALPPVFVEESLPSRWYPIIDHDACLACLECVNFCLFGVYTIDGQMRPVVQSPDACRDGCPACSRVCPGGAIMFPLHADLAVSGSLDAQSVAQQVRDHDMARQAREIRKGFLESVSTPDSKVSTDDELDRLVDQTDRFQE